MTRVYTTVGTETVDVTYSTNSNGYLSSITQGGVSYDFTYDVFGRRTSTKFASQTLASYTYNSRGLLDSTTYGNGTVHSLTYDESDRVISEAYDGTTAYSYSYNTEGYLGKTKDHALGITTYYGYDLVGRVTDVDRSDGVSTEFTYNEYNSIESYSVKKNNSLVSGAEYTYNANGLLSEVSVNGANGAYLNYYYDSLNRLTSKMHSLSGIPFMVNYSYLPGEGANTTGLVSSILYSDSGYRYMPKLSYTYDNKGNILTVSQNDVLHIKYTYDELDRLIREDNKDLNQSIVYTYDTRGNIQNKKIYAYTTGTLGSVTDTINYTYSNSWKDKLYTYDGQSISYDSIGNPTSYRGYTLTWQKGRQLASLNTGSKALSFKYDIDGLRTEKKVGSTTYSYLWSSGLLMQQSDGTNTLNFGYAPDGKAIEVDFNGNAYYYIYNLQGDVIGLYNNGGSVVVEYIYDSWGKLISTTGSLASTLGKLNPFRYRGYIYDDETGLYYLRSRYYDPDTGRFLNADIYASTATGLNGFNMFAYCSNNPIIYVDDTGTRQVIGIDACGGPGNYSTMNDYVYGTTFSIGGSFGYTSGNYSSTTSYVLSADNDKIAIQKTNSDGFATGQGASSGLVITLTDANSVLDLEGRSTSVGGTIVYSSLGFSVDYIEFNPRSNSNVLCRGISITIPVGIETEIHEYVSDTKTLKYWETPIIAFLENLLK